MWTLLLFALALTGPGRLSVDHVAASRRIVGMGVRSDG